MPVRRTPVREQLLVALHLPTKHGAVAQNHLAQAAMLATPTAHARFPPRKHAKPTTIVRRTKNAPTVIASTANKILPCGKSGLSAAFFYIFFRVRISSLVIARPRQRQNNPLTPPLRPVSCK